MAANHSIVRAGKGSPIVRILNPKTVLANFAVYLSAQIGLGETTIGNYLSVMRRIFPALGMRPTVRAVDKYVAAMRSKGLSQSHIVNTSIALERYGLFMHIGIKLGRPKQPYKEVQGTLSEAEMARFIGAAAGGIQDARAVLPLRPRGPERFGPQGLMPSESIGLCDFQRPPHLLTFERFQVVVEVVLANDFSILDSADRFNSLQLLFQFFCGH
jgi:hypothetical protein